MENEIERHPYGSRFNPACLWRNLDGDYFGFESDRQSLLAYMSSDIELTDFIERMDKLVVPWNQTLPGSYLGTIGSTGDVHHEGTWRELQSRLVGETAVQALVVLKHGLEVTWQAAYMRFDDRDTVRTEVGIISDPPNPTVTSEFIQKFGPTELLDTGNCHFQIRKYGMTRSYDV